ncbi:unnamed protein product [Nesidiocoris tenuis]|uniref:Uncharacterized protein n=1 Tax=Nesidiocoris tenuis TaxID=355587 RepID=A0A6H5G680_9HEMI|nr:unnamed protein product [Nesidiocoris tenuis]
MFLRQCQTRNILDGASIRRPSDPKTDTSIKLQYTYFIAQLNLVFPEEAKKENNSWSKFLNDSCSSFNFGSISKLRIQPECSISGWMTNKLSFARISDVRRDPPSAHRLRRGQLGREDQPVRKAISPFHAYTASGDRSFHERIILLYLHWSSQVAISRGCSPIFGSNVFKKFKLSNAQATDDVGAATSYGLSSTKASQTILGVGAAGTKSSGAISTVHNSAIGTTNQQMSMVQRIKRDDTNANTDLQAVSGDNSEGNMGSTGVQAGPVATSISLGALLLDGGNSYSTVNAGSAAAHAVARKVKIKFKVELKLKLILIIKLRFKLK